MSGIPRTPGITSATFRFHDASKRWESRIRDHPLRATLMGRADWYSACIELDRVNR